MSATLTDSQSAGMPERREPSGAYGSGPDSTSRQTANGAAAGSPAANLAPGPAGARTPLSREDLHILRHSLGLDDTGRGEMFRNSYVLGPDGDGFARLKDLQARGLMIDHGPAKIYGGMHRFSVTYMGRELASLRDPLTRKERGRRIYRYWLKISDCFPDSNFGDFLTKPEFADSRARARDQAA